MLIIIFLILIFICIYIFAQVNYTKIRKINLVEAKLQNNSSLKILQITDFHNSQSNIIKNRIKKILLENEVHIVVLTGDIIDSRTRNYKDTVTFIKELMDMNRKINFYFIKGNHEWNNKHGLNFVEDLEYIGVMQLNNKNRIVNIDRNRINICGVDDYNTKHDDLDKTFKGIDFKNYTLLLSHCPDIIKKEDSIKSDLILCGHTHGGQVRLPLIGALVAPGQGMFPKYNKGLYKLNDFILYVDSGVGTTRLPLRFFNSSQVTILNIKGYN